MIFGLHSTLKSRWIWHHWFLSWRHFWGGLILESIINWSKWSLLLSYWYRRSLWGVKAWGLVHGLRHAKIEGRILSLRGLLTCLLVEEGYHFIYFSFLPFELFTLPNCNVFKLLHFTLRLVLKLARRWTDLLSELGCYGILATQIRDLVSRWCLIGFLEQRLFLESFVNCRWQMEVTVYWSHLKKWRSWSHRRICKGTPLRCSNSQWWNCTVKSSGLWCKLRCWLILSVEILAILRIWCLI